VDLTETFAVLRDAVIELMISVRTLTKEVRTLQEKVSGRECQLPYTVNRNTHMMNDITVHTTFVHGSAHLAYHMHKGGRKTPIIVFQRKRQATSQSCMCRTV